MPAASHPPSAPSWPAPHLLASTFPSPLGPRLSHRRVPRRLHLFSTRRRLAVGCRLAEPADLGSQLPRRLLRTGTLLASTQVLTLRPFAATLWPSPTPPGVTPTSSCQRVASHPSRHSPHSSSTRPSLFVEPRHPPRPRPEASDPSPDPTSFSTPPPRLTLPH